MNEQPAPIGIPVIAGYNAESEPVAEQLVVVPFEQKSNIFQLVKSPAFVRDLAAGDRIRLTDDDDDSDGGYELVQRSGNLSIRVFSKDNTDNLELILTPELELIDGQRDLHSERTLVYSIHVSIGFNRIESILNNAVGRYPDSVWYYGNVYDPADGVTPLDWWQEFLANT